MDKICGIMARLKMQIVLLPVQGADNSLSKASKKRLYSCD